MARIEGRLKLLGAGHHERNGFLVREVIEVGDHELRKIYYSPYMKSYIDQSLEEPIALGIQRVVGAKTVFAVALADGRVKYDPARWLINLFVLYAVLGLGCLALAVMFSAWFLLPVAFVAWMAQAPVKAWRLRKSFAPLGQGDGHARPATA